MFFLLKSCKTAFPIQFFSFMKYASTTNLQYVSFQAVKYNFSTNVARLDDAADENAKPATGQKEQKKFRFSLKLKRKTPNHPTIIVDSSLVGSQIVDPRGRLPANVDESIRRHFQITGKRKKSC